MKGHVRALMTFAIAIAGFLGLVDPDPIRTAAASHTCGNPVDPEVCGQNSGDAFEMITIYGDERIPYTVIPLRPERVRTYGRSGRILRKEGILRYYRTKVEVQCDPSRPILAKGSGID